MRKRYVSAIIVSVVVIIFICNIPLTYHIGVDGQLTEKNIPLYAKACGYLYRDWMYKDMVREITNRKKDDLERALAILHWTHGNIKGGVPAGLKTIDDHPLNIIIRQYGSGDQIQDVFTILCSYAGMKAGMAKCYNADRTLFDILALVYIKGKWLVFDATEDKYFFNGEGQIASVEDCLKKNVVLTEKDASRYEDFFDDLKHVDYSAFTRPDEQMPLRRIPAQIQKWLKTRSAGS